MFDFTKHVVIPTQQEVKVYATDQAHDTENETRRINNPNQTLKNMWVHVEVMDIAREAKVFSLLEIAMSLIQIITEPTIRKKKREV